MRGKLKLIVGLQDLDGYSDREISKAYIVQLQAEVQAGLYWRDRGQSNAPWVPAQWTAWLLMDKAGVPRELIAYVCRADPRHLRKRLRIAKALLMFPPYAARIESLMEKMPPFGAAQMPAITPAKEAPCAAPAG